jgi:ribosome-associated protein
MTKKAFSALQKTDLIVEFADEIKAERIERLDVRKKTSVADFFVICTGNSDTHIRAIADRVSEKMREEGIKPLRVEQGGSGSGWVLLDYGDVVFHVMLEEKRQFYDLESLWASMRLDRSLVDAFDANEHSEADEVVHTLETPEPVQAEQTSEELEPSEAPEPSSDQKADD